MFFRIAARSFLLWFGAAWLAFGLFFAVMGFRERESAREYRRDSRATQGTVVSKSIRRANRRDTPRTRYEVVYRFTDVDQVHENREGVSVETWETLVEGGPVRVTYLPGELRTGQIEEGDTTFSAWIGMGLGGLFAIIGGALFWWSLRKAYRESQAIEGGAAAHLPEPLGEAAAAAIPGFLRGVWTYTKIIGVVVAAAVIAELVPPIKRLDVYLEQHRQPWLGLTIATAAAGLALLMGGILWMVVGGSTSESITFAEWRRAWRSGAWRTDSRWRRRLVTATGAVLMGLGLFGVFFVVGPGAVKVLIAGALVYAAVRAGSTPKGRS